MSEIPSLEILYVLFILLPGFVTLGIETALVYEAKKSNLDKVVKALFYSIVNFTIAYLIMTVLNQQFGYLPNPRFEELPNAGSLNPDLPSLLCVLAVSIVLGLLIGFMRTHDIHMKVLRRLKLTKRTSRGTIWLDIFHEKYFEKFWLTTVLEKIERKRTKTDYGAWIYVHLKNGKEIYGWPEHFADNFEEGPVLFLTDAYWIDEGRERQIENPGILINSFEIQYIRFYSEEENKVNQQKSNSEEKPLKESKNPRPQKETPPPESQKEKK